MNINNVEFKYGQRQLFNDLNLTIKRHAVTSIIGPNGSGKSTLLQMLAGYLQPQAGCVYIKGNDLNALGKKQLAQMLSAVHQNNTAPEDFTVKTLLRYGRYSHHRWLKKDVKGEAVIERVLEQFNLTKYADRPIGALSGGEKQRVFIAMALVQEPQYLLLDEPTTFLDLHYQYQVLEMIRQLNDMHRLTIIMVLHDINQALTYSDELICVANGEIAAQGKPQAIVTPELLKTIYQIDAKIIHDKDCGILIGKCHGGC